MDYETMRDHVVDRYIDGEGLNYMPTIEMVWVYMDDEFSREAWGLGEHDYCGASYGIFDELLESFNYYKATASERAEW